MALLPKVLAQTLRGELAGLVADPHVEAVAAPAARIQGVDEDQRVDRLTGRFQAARDLVGDQAGGAEAAEVIRAARLALTDRVEVERGRSMEYGRGSGWSSGRNRPRIGCSLGSRWASARNAGSAFTQNSGTPSPAPRTETIRGVTGPSPALEGRPGTRIPQFYAGRDQEASYFFSLRRDGCSRTASGPA